MRNIRAYRGDYQSLDGLAIGDSETIAKPEDVTTDDFRRGISNAVGHLARTRKKCFKTKRQDDGSITVTRRLSREQALAQLEDLEL